MRPIFWENWLTVFGGMTDGDQALAAEPGFHGEPPGGGQCVVMTVGHGSDSPPEVGEQQSENGSALAAIPAQALSRVVEDGAGAAAFEAAAGTMVEFMDGCFDSVEEPERGGGGRGQALIQRALEVTDAFFHGAVVAGQGRRIVERQHGVTGEQGVEMLVVEG